MNKIYEIDGLEVFFDPATNEIVEGTGEGALRRPVGEEDSTRANEYKRLQVIGAELAAYDQAQAALLSTRASAQALLNDMLVHAQIPIATRSAVDGAVLDVRAGNLLVSTLGSSDPVIVGYTAKITALALRLTRERDEYESGLTP